jgi:hypothetical protein
VAKGAGGISTKSVRKPRLVSVVAGAILKFELHDYTIKSSVAAPETRLITVNPAYNLIQMPDKTADIGRISVICIQ